ncbi:ParB/RepB/Spo0J family partition protein [Bordetella petrii]|nr:ParB/RepB/Spo0J family partition protein [Bordetella petrii]
MSLAAKQAGSDLDLASLGDLATMLDGPQRQVGEPDLFDIDLIDEDRNVRLEYNPGLSKESIDELRETLRRDGMLSPISLRPNPERHGRYLINFGHRRFRAAKAEGWRQVPAVIRNKFDRFAQMAENLKREGITALEVAEFIRDELANGRTHSEIAVGLGKSKAWVTQHAKMLDLPSAVAEAVAAGKVTDVTLASELAAAHREDPAAVQAVLQGGAKPTRAIVKAIRKPKVDPQKAAAEQPASPGQQADRSAAAEAAFAKMRAARVRQEAERPAIQEAGQAALQRLLSVARSDTGQAGVVARFLLNLYNGNRFPFDNTDLRRLDYELCEDCIAVLRMDSRPVQEVHTYFENGSKIWEQLAKRWGFKDFYGEDSWR